MSDVFLPVLGHSGRGKGGFLLFLLNFFGAGQCGFGCVGGGVGVIVSENAVVGHNFNIC